MPTCRNSGSTPHSSSRISGAISAGAARSKRRALGSLTRPRACAKACSPPERLPASLLPPSSGAPCQAFRPAGCPRLFFSAAMRATRLLFAICGSLIGGHALGELFDLRRRSALFRKLRSLNLGYATRFRFHCELAVSRTECRGSR
jgi:hypothetical protein